MAHESVPTAMTQEADVHHQTADEEHEDRNMPLADLAGRKRVARE
jgi:hypothetical protein